MGEPRAKLRRGLWRATICVVVWLAGCVTGVAASGPNPTAEAWVVEQVNAGQAADLDLRFPDEADRTLGAALIEDLLSGTRPDAKIPRHGVRIQHAVFVGPIDLENVEVDSEVRLEQCRFEGELNLSQSRWKRDLSLAGSAFLGASFNRLKTDGSIVVKDATFAGPVAFMNAEIAGQFQADGAHFAETSVGAVFDGLKIGGAALFNHAVFAGPVTFVTADVGGQFQAEAAQFSDPEHAANFNGLKVGNIAWFNKALFAGPTDFRGASVGGQFWADETRFEHAQQTAMFKGMKVDNAAYFRNVAFAGPTSMADATFLDLFVSGAQKGAAPPTPLLDLSRTVVRRDLRLEDLRLRELVATSIRVAGVAYLGRLQVQSSADLEHSSFLALTLHDVVWPEQPAQFRLNGTTYQLLSVEQSSDPRAELLALTNNSAYSTQVYAELEAYFRQQGDVAWANRAYVAQRRRERAENLTWLSIDWWWNGFLDGFVLYGRGPGRALLWGAFVIVAGWVIFRRKSGMRPRGRTVPVTDYWAFWYSLDLFLPFLDLQVANQWEPRPERRLARHYVRIHALLGWVLVPIGLLSVTGIIK